MIVPGKKWSWLAGLLAAVCIAGGCFSAPPPRETRVVIASSPEQEADVTIGDMPRGKTPVTLVNPPPGETVAVLTRENFERTSKTIVFPDQGEERIVIDMRPLRGYLTIESTPAGAQVFLDGREHLGNTPLTSKEVPIGKHTYEVRLDNYRTATGEIEIKEDYRYQFAHVLAPKNAQLAVVSRPSGAKLWLNGELLPQLSPAKFEVSPGDYILTLYAKGYDKLEQPVVLGPNESKTLELVLTEGKAPEGMVLIPAGPFIMGLNGASPDEKPQRTLELPAFYMDQYEVTNAEFKLVFPDHVFPDDAKDKPVTGVSFVQASAYAKAVGKRLPTEEEWEKAARGTDGREYPWGMEFVPENCNSGSEGTIRVGRCRMGVSPFKCYDMAGNAYEWTASWYQAYPGNPDVTKDYGQQFRVLRGGSYKSDRFGVRCARRHYDHMESRQPDYGFRCAKDVE
ncbi:MAG TPA: SUMF1/EgtB/PvdO family nonheme iron enzyme [Candidatus Hydrogenedentes bacterium]|nr:SUMF1/EgtB/PvdO family nonheme iron enzyme [Candidatus Hydrogenedentota bacterium]HRT22178.1 SUMF1/EgtB/PvdO family nonheme iron enzyme [Candidatus Hydrogenedentota bacterium]HRT66954.1 SUMF1/EgtB/PvdO family nonheme iron enzyme [Candidatus Hydrogenedentota bacterium]